MYQLSNDLSDEFLENPEFGMGYHIACVKIDGICENVIIFNSDLLIKLSELSLLQREFATISMRLNMLPQLRSLNIEKIYFSSDLPFLDSLMLGEINSPIYWPKLTNKRFCKVGEKFVRYSAFKADKRIKSDGTVYPGTYATSYNDSKIITNGFAAVGRFALPCPFAAVYVHDITIDQKQVEIQLGTVRPNFNQSGGGAEVLFIDGTPPKCAVKRLQPIDEI